MRLFACLALVFGLAFGLEYPQIIPTATKKINEALSILANKNLNSQQKQDQVTALFDPFFDYALMAKLSLGSRNYLALSPDQQDRYTSAFKAMLKRVYAGRLKDYKDESIVIDGLENPQASRAWLNMHIDSKGKRYDLMYKFYDAGEGRGWLVYDIDIVGVSIVQNYKGQFADIMANGGYDELLSKLNSMQ